MITKLLLTLLEKLPYRTKFGFSLSDELKMWYFFKYGARKAPKRCLCGGYIITNYRQSNEDCVGWETFCDMCKIVIGED